MRHIKMPINVSAKDRFRFMNYVNKSENCWEWNGNNRGKGYGRFGLNKKHYQAHRLSFYISTGRDPGDFLVCHKCDNRKCVRPEHLFLGDESDNSRDCVIKNRHRETQKTHCPKGHLYSADNLSFYATKDGRTWRRCRTCKDLHNKLRYKKWQHLTQIDGEKDD